MNPDGYKPSPAELYYALLLDAGKQGLFHLEPQYLDPIMANIETAVDTYKAYVDKLS